MAALVTGLCAALCTVVASPALASEPEILPCVIECEVEETSGSPSLVVINVGWETGEPLTSAPLNPGDSSAFATYIGGPVNEWFANSAPGLIKPWAVRAGGDYTIAAPHFPFPTEPSRCDKAEFFSEVRQRAEAAARANGVRPENYSVVAITWSRPFCKFAGLQTGNTIALTKKAETPAHELGHYLGLRNHANGVVCFNALGAEVPLSTNCRFEEYGDNYDTMAEGRGAYNAIYANRLGWLNGQYYSLSASDSTSTFFLKPYSELPHGMRAIRLQDGSTTLWVEYRLPIGADANLKPAEPGLIIHRQLETANGPESQLLDMTPEDTAYHAALGVGQTWANPLGMMKITNSGASASGVTVTIASQLVTVPNLRGQNLVEADTALRAVGLQLGNAKWVSDPNCEFIERIMSSSPSAGTRARAGTSVTVSIGQLDPLHSCN
jgi:hypothetical protein